MSKIIIISKIILTLAFLNIFAWTIFHVHTGGKRLGVFTDTLKNFSMFPTLAVSAFKEISSPERLIKTDPYFESFNALSYDVFALSASFESSKWVIRLTNLADDSTVLKWHLDEKKYLNTGRVFSHAEPRLPILLADSSLIVHHDESNNLFRLDANSEIMWHNTKHQFHHAIHPDNQRHIWACTREYVQSSRHNFEYWDNYLTKVDVDDGKVLYHQSLTEILNDNNLSYLIHGCGNAVPRSGFDPLHLNEVQPVLSNGTYWNEGDVFISLRHRSLILLYRPSTHKIMRIIHGPFFNQHDVNILSDSTLSLFNNNVSSLQKNENTPKQDDQEFDLLPGPTLNQRAEVLIYNLNDSSFSTLYPERFAEHRIFTETQGLHHILSNGDVFVESQNEGKIYIFNKDKTLLKKYFHQPVNRHTARTHWIRIYENLDFLN